MRKGERERERERKDNTEIMYLCVQRQRESEEDRKCVFFYVCKRDTERESVCAFAIYL